MRFIVPSIGRCGSSVMAHQLHKASGAPNWVYVQAWDLSRQRVVKTHAPFYDEPDDDYRAVFCWGHIGDIIHSMYLGMDGHLVPHLRHLEVSAHHVDVFTALSQASKADAWLYLVQGDKLGFKRNLSTWERANNVLFVHYDDWLRDAAETYDRVSEFAGLTVKPRTLHDRRGDFTQLPVMVQDGIWREYGELLYA
jgi:hypothetical protein